MTTHNDTANKILDIAANYTQTRGFNAFSYRDIQAELGIKTSSIHYYFPTKQDLATSMIERYLEVVKTVLEEIGASKKTAPQKLQAFANIFITTAKDGKFCLCGMLAADILGMPKEVEKHLAEFFTLSETWMTETIAQGIADKEIKKTTNPKLAAAHFLATLEGGLLIARTRKQSSYLKNIVTEVLKQLKN